MQYLSQYFTSSEVYQNPDTKLKVSFSEKISSEEFFRADLLLGIEQGFQVPENYFGVVSKIIENPYKVYDISSKAFIRLRDLLHEFLAYTEPTEQFLQLVIEKWDLPVVTYEQDLALQTKMLAINYDATFLNLENLGIDSEDFIKYCVLSGKVKF